MIKGALSGELENSTFRTDPIFGLEVPTAVPGVPDGVLNPRSTWRDQEEYDRRANDLACKFNENFRKYEDGASQEIRDARPSVKVPSGA
jgi:phosphoenolpyruvate carboxykinase (ATP)